MSIITAQSRERTDWVGWNRKAWHLSPTTAKRKGGEERHAGREDFTLPAGPRCHAAIEQDWRTRAGQALVLRWGELTGLRERVNQIKGKK